MNFFKRLFGRTPARPADSTIKNDGATSYITTEPGAYIFNKDAEPEYTYTDLTPAEYKHIQASQAILKDAFAPLLKFDKEPVHHPENLDEYLTVWGSTGFNNFMDIEPNQHIAFLSYNFGQWLVDAYGMEWKIKSDGQGTATVVRLAGPAEIELYPIDRTLRAVEKKELAVYVGIDAKLQRALQQFG